jgi:hypothetical protein
MKRQIDANIAMRGALEPAYFFLGAARVNGNTLDYMSQMAGWSVLDYGLYDAEQPAEYVRLGYASLLSSWALVNSGTPESGYGYWYPGKENDGAAGWNFQTHKYGGTWGLGHIGRGIWPYCGEIDHGLAGGIRAATTLVMDDPIFGRIALGGSLSAEEGSHSVVPRDGARRALHFLTGDDRVHLRLNTDGFKRGAAVVFNDDFSRIEFQLENRSGRPHEGSFEFRGLPDGEYEVLLNGTQVHSFMSSTGQRVVYSVPLTQAHHHAVVIQR